MPNTFGPAGKPQPLYDPRHARQHRLRFARDMIPDLAKANAFYMPGGRWPACGYILMRRGDYNLIDPYSVSLQLQIDDFVSGPLTFQNLTVVQARCVTRGFANDPDAIYLVEITDRRGVLTNKWFQQGTFAQYNVRAPAYPEQFYSTTLDSGVPWTWSRMVGDIWNQMPLLGSYLGLPIASPPPNVSVDGFVFPGTSVWDALCEILDYLGMVVAVDLTSPTPYTIVGLGDASSTLGAFQAKFLGNLEDDYEYIDTGSGRVPAEVTVYFHRRNQYYGTEETVRRDGLQWQATPLFQMTLPAPLQFQTAAGRAFQWSAFTVRYDVDGHPLPADIVTANTVAQDEVASFFAREYRKTFGYLHQVYTGALPIATGPQVDGVCWEERFADGRRLGWRTRIVRGPEPPFEEVAYERGD